MTHGGTTILPGGAISLRTSAGLTGDADRVTTRSTHSDGKRTEDQRRLISMTAVEVVSRLALETGRDDVSDHVAFDLSGTDTKLLTDHPFEHIITPPTASGY